MPEQKRHLLEFLSEESGLKRSASHYLKSRARLVSFGQNATPEKVPLLAVHGLLSWDERLKARLFAANLAAQDHPLVQRDYGDTLPFVAEQILGIGDEAELAAETVSLDVHESELDLVS